MPHDPRDTDAVRKKRRLSWPVIVVLLLAGHATLIISAVSLAVRGTGRGVVPDYYAQAIDYDAHKQALADSARLGWQLTLSPGQVTGPHGQRPVTATLADAAGRPIADAVVDVRLIRLSDGRVDNLTFSPADHPGGYRAVAALPDAGNYRAECRVEHAGQRYVKIDDLKLSGHARPAPAEGGAS